LFKSEKNKEVKQYSKEYEEASRKLEKSVEKMASLIKDDEKMVEDYRLINTSRKKAKETIVSEKAKLEELSKIPEKNTKEIAELEKVLMEKNEKEEKHFNEIMANLQTETHGLQDAKQKYEPELVQLKATQISIHQCQVPLINHLKLSRKLL
jgi:small-conductance mechanosensitive channel